MAGRPSARTFLLPLAWLVAAGVIAVGAALIVANLDPASAAARPELTSVADAAATTALDAAAAQLQAETESAARLQAAAKQAIARALAGDPAGVETALRGGTAALLAADAASTAFDTAIAAVSGMGANRETRLSPRVIARYDALLADQGLATGLDAEWTVFTGRVGQVVTVAGVLGRHDTETAAATALGAAGKYADAIKALDRPQATLDEIGAMRNVLSATVDVHTLTTWIDEHVAYDAALRNLYAALVASNGAVTDAVKAAGAAEAAARAMLPADTRMLTLILSDVAQGGANQHAVAIAGIHDALAAALDAQARLAASPAPSVAPASAAPPG